MTERRSPLLGFVIAAIAGAIVGSLISRSTAAHGASNTATAPFAASGRP